MRIGEQNNGVYTSQRDNLKLNPPPILHVIHYNRSLPVNVGRGLCPSSRTKIDANRRSRIHPYKCGYNYSASELV